MTLEEIGIKDIKELDEYYFLVELNNGIKIQRLKGYLMSQLIFINMCEKAQKDIKNIYEDIIMTNIENSKKDSE